MMSAPPLRGRRILVTRGADKTDDLPGLLEAAGAVVVRVPLIAVQRLAPALDITTAVAAIGAAAGASPS